ncbi:Uncharacterised protein [Brevundimonas diminuta]|uniref:Uncharacterized protein n=1 Tax=Brevundimonas diminuta TaxID=293 RepID=A0A2X1AE63_BREDI|nr:Uncharacterised protein [Brevundimonas diminuta]
MSCDCEPLVEVERTTWPSGSNFCSCVVERLWSMSAVTWTRAAPAPTTPSTMSLMRACIWASVEALDASAVAEVKPVSSDPAARVRLAWSVTVTLSGFRFGTDEATTLRMART